MTALNQDRHHVLLLSGHLFQFLQQPPDLPVVARSAEFLKIFDLFVSPGIIIFMQIDVRMFALGIFVNPDLGHLSRLQAFLKGIGLLGHLALDIAAGHGMLHAAHCLYPFHFLNYFFFHLFCQRFNKVGAGQRVNRIAQAHFLHENLQGSKGQEGRPLGRDGIRFVKRAQGRGLGTT